MYFDVNKEIYDKEIIFIFCLNSCSMIVFQISLRDKSIIKSENHFNVP